MLKISLHTKYKNSLIYILQFTKECGEETPHTPLPTASFTEVPPVYGSKRRRSFSGLQLAEAISQELRCMEELGVFINSIPEQMCFLGRDSNGSNNNTQCWTGAAVGRYICTTKPL